MSVSTIALGICKGARCRAEGFGPVERYEGPGMFCPNCGELLQAYTSEPSQWAIPLEKTVVESVSVSASPDSGVSPVALESSHDVSAAETRKPKSQDKAVARRALVITAIVGAIVLAVVVIVSGALDQNHSAAAPKVGICSSSMTSRLARDVLKGYTANQAFADHFEMRATECDLTFSVITGTRRGAISSVAVGLNKQSNNAQIAHDGIVAIVNPQNAVSQLSLMELRSIIAGRIHNWRALHGADKPIVVFIPSGDSDESQIVSSVILNGAPAGSDIVRLPTSADVVRAVATPNGRNAIGFVSFSAAEPGKVVAITEFPAPSTVSISEHRYPLSVGIFVHASQSTDTTVSSLLKYATSENAKALAAGDGFVL